MERQETTGNGRICKKTKKESQEISTQKARNEGDELKIDSNNTKRKEMEVKGKCIKIKGNEKKRKRWK